MIQITRRHVLKSGAAAGAVAGLGGTFGASLALAENQGDIVIGASLPVTGVFANSRRRIRRRHGGLSATGATKTAGSRDASYASSGRTRPTRSTRAVAVFRKITASDNPPFYYGDSTGWSKAVAAEVSSRWHHAHLGPVVQLRPRRPGEGPLLLHVRARPTAACSRYCSGISRPTSRVRRLRPWP